MLVNLVLSSDMAATDLKERSVFIDNHLSILEEKELSPYFYITLPKDFG